MKRLVIYLVAILGSSPMFAQRFEINPDVHVDVNRNVNVQVKRDVKVDLDVLTNILTDFKVDVDVNLNSLRKRDMSDYQQDTQEIDIPLTSPGQRGTLRVESHNGSVTVTGYEGQSVKVKMIKFSKKVNKTETKDGMRLVSSGGFNVQAQEYNNTVKIDNEGWNNRVDFEIQVPRNFDVKAETYNNGDLTVKNIEGEVNAENYNGPINLEDISGLASASTYNGAVIVKFTKVTPNKAMAFSTYNGNVDITFPASAKVTSNMKTNKDIFTDFENFDLNEFSPRRERNGERGTKLKFENWVEGKINGGGGEVTMETTNGNIYIRKGN